MSDILNYAKDVFKIEAQSISDLSDLLTDDFEKSIRSILESSGKLIVSGMGKSGIIGKKIAATLASTGTPSFFVHPGEAFHGDLGMISENDIVLLISNSGETNEVLSIIPFFKAHKNTLISMSGNPESTLAKNTDFHLNIAVKEEADPLQLAPTSSTTATLAMGDAIAVALMKERKFKAENFAKFHPGGSLGRRLLTKVEDEMRKDNLPILKTNATTKEIIHVISEGRLGLAVITGDQSKILGIITDGDIRRTMEEKEDDFFNLTANDFVKEKMPKTIAPKEKIEDAKNLMNAYKINSLLVAEDNRLVGVIQIYDLNI